MSRPNTRLQHEQESGIVYTGHDSNFIECSHFYGNVKGVEETYKFKCNGDLACCGAECCTPIPAGIPLWLLILLLLLLALLLLALCLGILYYCLKFCKRRPPPPPSKPLPPTPPPKPLPPTPKQVKSVDGKSTVLRESTAREETDEADIADIDSLPDRDADRRRAVKTGSLSSLHRRELARLREQEAERARLEAERTEALFRERNRDLYESREETTLVRESASLSPKLRKKHRGPSYTRLNPDWWRRDSVTTDTNTESNLGLAKGDTWGGEGREEGRREGVSAKDWEYPGAAVRSARSAKFESSAVEEKIFVPSPMEESFVAAPKPIAIRPHDESEISSEQKALLSNPEPVDEQTAKFMYYRPFVPSPMEEVLIPAPGRPSAQLHHVSEISTAQLPQASHVRTEELRQAEVLNNRPGKDDVAAY